MNALITIDALFKNSKKQQLRLLQSNELMTILRQPFIAQNPHFQNFLYKCVSAWVANCATQNCLDPKFSEWQEEVCSSYFVPKMTVDIKRKFLNDISAASDVIVMFAQCMVANFNDRKSSDADLLKEILPNVREIKARMIDLIPTVVDPTLHTCLIMLNDSCDYCFQVYNDYKKYGKLDPVEVLNQVDDTHRSLSSCIARDGKPLTSTTCSHTQKQDQDTMPVQEFWQRFYAINDAGSS